MNEATSVTESTAKEVMQVSEKLGHQEGSLVDLRQELVKFLLEVRKVG